MPLFMSYLNHVFSHGRISPALNDHVALLQLHKALHEEVSGRRVGDERREGSGREPHVAYMVQLCSVIDTVRCPGAQTGRSGNYVVAGLKVSDSRPDLNSNISISHSWNFLAYALEWVVP